MSSEDIWSSYHIASEHRNPVRIGEEMRESYIFENYRFDPFKTLGKFRVKINQRQAPQNLTKIGAMPNYRFIYFYCFFYLFLGNDTESCFISASSGWYFRFPLIVKREMLGPVLRPPLDSSFPRETDPRSTAPLDGEESGRRKDNKENQLEESLASGLTSTHGHSSHSDSCAYVFLLIVNLSLLFSRVLINFRDIRVSIRNCTFSSANHVLIYRCRLPSRIEAFFPY